MVGHRFLEPRIGVRIPVPEPTLYCTNLSISFYVMRSLPRAKSRGIPVPELLLKTSETKFEIRIRNLTNPVEREKADPRKSNTQT